MRRYSTVTIISLVLPIAVSHSGAAQGFPPDGLAASAAFHQASRTLIVVGDHNSSPAVITWLWNGSAWRRDTSSGPSPRDEPLLAYDSDHQRVLLFGGERGADPPLSDTWEWDGTAWQKLDDSGPPPRLGAQMVYDRHRHRLVIFGGAKPGGGEYNDTWEWDGVGWIEATHDGASGSPPGRVLFGLAYDPGRRRVVLFGGTSFVSGRPEVRDDTWEWDGSAWRQIPVQGPESRDHLAMVYSPAARAVILHGGGSPQLGLLGDTWKFDGTIWTRLATDGPVRGRHRLVYDDNRNLVLLFGGWAPRSGDSPQRRPSDLWQFDGVRWQRIASASTHD